MNFVKGGIYSYNRDEGCFIKYMIDIIQSAQLGLKNEQWDINVDFEEFISSIRRFGEPLIKSIFIKLLRFLNKAYSLALYKHFITKLFLNLQTKL